MAQGFLEGLTAGINAGGCPEGRPCPVETINDERSLDEAHRYIKQANRVYNVSPAVGFNRDGIIKNIGGQKPPCVNPLFDRNGVEVGCQ